MYENVLNGTSWSGWASLGDDLIGEAAAVSPTSTTVDIFARGTTNALWRQFWKRFELVGVVPGEQRGDAWVGARCLLDWRQRSARLRPSDRWYTPGNRLGRDSVVGVVQPWRPASGQARCARQERSAHGFARADDNRLWERSWTGTFGRTGSAPGWIQRSRLRMLLRQPLEPSLTPPFSRVARTAQFGGSNDSCNCELHGARPQAVGRLTSAM